MIYSDLVVCEHCWQWFDPEWIERHLVEDHGLEPKRGDQ